mgnify:CR=1 FL=1
MYWIVIILLFIVSIASLYYFVRSLIVIGRHNTLYAVLAFFFAPIVHIVFYLTQKETIGIEDRSYFKRYFMLIGAVIVLAIIMGAVAPSIVNSAAYYQ